MSQASNGLMTLVISVATSHPCGVFLPFARQNAFVLMPARAAAAFSLMLVFSITAGTNPSPQLGYSDFGGLTTQLTCSILVFLYLIAIFISKYLLKSLIKVDHYAELSPSIRFFLDMTMTLVTFIGAVSGASAINGQCPLDKFDLHALCYYCPVTPNFSPSVPDDCKSSIGGNNTEPFECPETCPNSFLLTIVSGSSVGMASGPYIFVSICMFLGVIFMIGVTMFTYAKIHTANDGFEDIGAGEYNAYSGDVAKADTESPPYNSGIAYTTGDAPVNSHDL